jgi:mono/diheme cytochrome c family protein
MRPSFLLLALSFFVAGCSAGSGESGPSVQTSSTGESESTNPTAESEGPGDPGEAIYKKYCIVCHQADGSGKPVGGGRAIAGDFSASGPDSVLSKSDEQLLRSIKVGRSGTVGVMPKWMGVLDQHERKDVLAYIRASFTAAPSSGASGEAPEGTSPEGP